MGHEEACQDAHQYGVIGCSLPQNFSKSVSEDRHEFYHFAEIYSILLEGIERLVSEFLGVCVLGGLRAVDGHDVFYTEHIQSRQGVQWMRPVRHGQDIIRASHV